MQKTNYYWQGSSANNRTAETFAGPFNGFWSTEDVSHPLIYTPCAEQRILNINTELRVTPGASGFTSRVSMNTSEGDIDTRFNFSWIQC